MVSKIAALRTLNIQNGHNGLPKGERHNPGDDFDSRRIAKDAAFEKARAALKDAIHVGHDYLTETERDIIELIRAILARRIT